MSLANPEDVRWRQRLKNYSRALGRLIEAVELGQHRDLTDLEKQGLIQVFEFTHELVWQTIKDYLAYQGNIGIMGSRDAVREAFRVGLIHNGECWMEMITSRNMSSHTYNQALADDIAKRIIRDYYPLFVDFLVAMEQVQKRTEL